MKLRGYSLFFNFSHLPEIEDEGTRAGAVRIVFEEGMDSSLKDLRYSIVQKTMRQ